MLVLKSRGTHSLLVHKLFTQISTELEKIADQETAIPKSAKSPVKETELFGAHFLYATEDPQFRGAFQAA